MTIQKKIIGILCLMLMFIGIFSGCGKKEKIVIDNFYQAERLQVDGIPEEIELLREFSGMIWLAGKREGKSCLGSFDISKPDYQETIVELPENEKIIDFYIDKEENTTILTSETKMEQKSYLEKLRLYHYSKEGTVEMLSELKTCNSTYQVYITEKDIYLIEEGLHISVFDKKGNQNGISESTKRIEAICGDGQECYYIRADTTNNVSMIVGNIKQDGKVTEITKIKMQMGEDVSIFSSWNEKEELYYRDRTGVYNIKIKKSSFKKIIAWDSLGILARDLFSVLSLEKNQFFCFYGKEQCFLQIIEKGKQAEEEENTIDEIIFAASKIQDADRERVYRFNEEHEDCKIVIRDYSETDSSSEQFNLDIASGNSPDIINLSSVDPIMLAEKGFFTDLSVFMEQDLEVSKENLQDRLVELLEIDGKLYFLPTSFTIEALVGGKDDIGDRDRWTLEEFEVFCKEKRTEGVEEIVANMNSASFAGWDSRFTMEDYVDLNSGKVNFLTEGFEKLLFITKNYFLPQVDLSKPKDDKIKEGTASLINVFLIAFSQCANYQWIFGKEGYSFIGYPSQDGSCSGVGMRIENYYGIAETCTRKEEAWEFLRQYFLKETLLEEYSPGFSIRKDIIEYRKECAMAKKEYINEKGEQIVPMLKDNYIDVGDGITVKTKPLTEEQMKQIEELINKADILSMLSSIYSSVSNKIMDEVDDGLNQDKSIEEIMDIIQSRMSIMVSEQS